MSFYSDAVATAKPYFADTEQRESALAVIGELLNFVRTAEEVLSGRGGSDSARQGMSQLLVGFTIGLSGNAFWRQHAGYLMPVFATAVTSWGDSFGYLSSDTDQDRAAFMATNNAVAEVAVAVLYCAEGPVAAREKSMPLRRAFMNAGGGRD